MRTSASLFALAAVSSASAQVVSPAAIAQVALSFLSPECQSTLGELVNTSSPIYQCFQAESFVPVFTTNSSIIPPLDMFIEDVCASDPCSNELLNKTAQTIVDGCSGDLAKFGLGNDSVYTIIQQYPLAREITCLKTTEPVETANATIPLNSTAYNTTNGTFCITETLTSLSAYLGANLTVPYIATAALGGNTTAISMLSMIPPSALCSDCIFAAAGLIELEYPLFGEIVVNTTANLTINGYLNGTCTAANLTIGMNGTLPESIYPAAENSTFAESYVAGNTTFTPIPDAPAAPTINETAVSAVATAVASAAPAAEPVVSSAVSAASMAPSARGMSEKKRWIGQW